VFTQVERLFWDDVPFSVDARSISYFNQRVPTRIWRDQQTAMRILHRDTCMKLLDAMLETEPAPPWPQNPHVTVFFAFRRGRVDLAAARHHISTGGGS
jgi:hypothetical protein